jgi:hypothetical protein
MNQMTKRINLTIPDALFEDLDYWAKHEGRSMANLSAVLLESAVKSAKANKEFPSKDKEQLAERMGTKE